MNLEKYIPDELIIKSVNLKNTLGVFELAWNYECVINVITILQQKEIVILGGDVLDNGFLYTGDNWFYNGSDVEESIRTAKEYIESYYQRMGNNYYYVLVIKDSK